MSYISVNEETRNLFVVVKSHLKLSPSLKETPILFFQLLQHGKNTCSADSTPKVSKRARGSDLQGSSGVKGQRSGLFVPLMADKGEL